MSEIMRNVEVGGGEAGPELGSAEVAKGRPKLYATHGARQLAYRGRQRERGLHMVWVSLEHLALVRAMVKAEKEAKGEVAEKVAKKAKAEAKKAKAFLGDLA